ncbi:hypothetical protein P7K49_005825 [Saguinus oedipus]|uniref:CTLH domain-containing protein n=1 Tax=Saguinus oedipus TaxID=9490 RepID=A0ABQ9W0N6_SAGOE|nr:hypothetical protein P7K49_005825 [Saguinus oedipus]
MTLASDPGTALAHILLEQPWAQANTQSTLGTDGSRVLSCLEFSLRIQEFIELIRQNKRLDAVRWLLLLLFLNGDLGNEAWSPAGPPPRCSSGWASDPVAARVTSSGILTIHVKHMDRAPGTPFPRGNALPASVAWECL